MALILRCRTQFSHKRNSTYNPSKHCSGTGDGRSRAEIKGQGPNGAAALNRPGRRAVPIGAIATIRWAGGHGTCIFEGSLAMLPSAKDLEGKRVPNVMFKTRVNDQWKDVSTTTFSKVSRSSFFRGPAPTRRPVPSTSQRLILQRTNVGGCLCVVCCPVSY